MSDHFFNYQMKYPNCGEVIHGSDGFETDDWVEVFVFSGCSYKNVGLNCHSYFCPECHQPIDIDMVFRRKLFFPESIDRVKEYLMGMLPYVFENKGIYDHGWDPDIEVAVNRYASLYPEDQRLQYLKTLYYYKVSKRTIQKGKNMI